MVQIVIRPLDDVMKVYGDRLAKLSTGQQNRVLYRTLNAEGDKLKTRVIRSLTKQTGLRRKVIVKAVRRKGAYAGDLSYVLTTRGGNIRVKYFGAREAGKGVRAKPKGRSTFYAGAFMRSGPKGHRRASPRLRGHAFRNVEGGKWRGRIKVVRSDVYIPKEMVIDETRMTFETTTPAILMQVGRQLARVMQGF